MSVPRSAAALVAALVAALLLAACTGKMAPQPLPPPPPPPPAIGQEAPPPPPPTTETAGPTEPWPASRALASPAPEALRRITLNTADVVRAEGVYFLDVQTGVTEGWIYPEGTAHWGVTISHDNRFVIIRGEKDGYLVDRESRSVWEWNPGEVQLLLAEAPGFLFAEVEPEGPNVKRTGRYVWAGPDLKPRHTFALRDGAPWGSSPLLSPDGSRLALSLSGNSPEQQGLALLHLDTGELQRLDVPAAGYIGAASLRQWGEGFQLEAWATDDNPSRGVPDWYSVIRRISWDGAPAGDLRIPGTDVFFSPDGKWVAWEDWPAGDVASATLIAEATSLKPRLLALGTTPCFARTGGGGSRWLADSRGLVVDTATGYRLLTLDGQLQKLPAFDGLIWSGEPQPAPDHPDRFAIGRLSITNGAGTEQVGVTLEGHVTPASLSPWGATGAELRFALPPKVGGGACGERPPMDAQVLLPAAALPEFPLVVRSPDGCVALRDRPHSSGRQLACLPDGTRLASTRPRSDMTSLSWTDESWWLSVRTEKGETGWVSLAGSSVTWAVQ